MKNGYFLLPILLFLFVENRLFSQANCPIDVNAGPDIHYCQGDPNPQLSGSISGDYLNFVWSPAAGLSSTTVLDPTATVTTNKTYILTATGLTANLIVNGDFEQGNSGFTSSYTYTQNLVPEGTYDVVNNPNNDHPGFQPCVDHTSGGGNMMVVNGSANALTVWQQNVPVLPNMTYRFSYWGCSVVSASPAQQVFRINGVNVGSTLSFPSATCQWVQFSVTWNSGGSTNANLQLINLNTAAGGNDFAIDDINFQKQCTDADTMKIFIHPTAFKTVNATICDGSTYKVGNEYFDATGNYLVGLKTIWGCDSIVSLNLNVVTLDAQISPQNPTINCQNTSVLLNSAGSSTYPGSTFNWSASMGGSFSGPPNAPQITANSVGKYQLVLKYTNGQITCTDTAKVSVTASAQPPVVNAGPPATIGCGNPNAQLSGSASGAPNLQILWTTPNGNIVSGANTFTPTVNAAGQYILTATNLANGCTASDTTSVGQDLSVPMANAGPADTLDCLISQISLIGSASSGPNFQFGWTTMNGHFVSPPTTLTPLVDATGTYFLTVTNTSNGCSAISSVTISIDTIHPTASAGGPFTLDCTTPSDTILGTTNSIFPPVWTTVGGHFVSGQGSLTPVVDESGLYILSIKNNENNCETRDSVSIVKNIQPPVVDAGPPVSLTCAQPTAQLSGSVSSAGSNPTMAWTSLNGIFLNGQNTLTPTVNTPATYILTITNPQNGCSATDQTTVSADPNIPVLNIATPDTLSCFLKKQTLSATASGANFQLNWTTIGGHFLSGQTTLSPQIDAAGTYSLTATNPSNGCSTTATISVFENTQKPDVQIVMPQKLNCLHPFFALDASASSQPNPPFSYQWTTTDGFILAGPTTLAPVVNQAGTYALVVTDSRNGCSAAKSILVEDDFAKPTVEAGAADTLNCLVSQLNLNGNGTQTGSKIFYKWTTNGGFILNGDTTLQPTVNQAGIYFLTVINNENGCKSIDSVKISIDKQAPTVVISSSTILTCSVLTVKIGSSGSSVGSNFLYNWTTNGGHFLSGQTSMPSPSVDAAGDYFLQISNSKNGCTASATTTVLENKTPPTVEAGPSKTLNCGIASLALQGSATASSGSVQTNWTTTGGHFLSGQMSLSPQIDASGLYFLTATDSANGCSATDSTLVSPDANAPTVSIAPAELLTCSKTQIQLSGMATAAGGGSNLNLAWTTADGQILSGATSLDPTVGKPGTYLLTATDPTNGCKNSSAVVVSQDVSAPNIGFSGVLTLTCSQTTGQLSASISTVGNDFSFVWTTQNGQILNGSTTLNPTVGKAGDYILTATDLSTGCTATASTMVLQNVQPPVAVIGAAMDFTCLLKTQKLETAGSSIGAGFNFNWTTTGGMFVSGQNSMIPTVGKKGLYTLIIKNLANGCADTATVLVNENITPPTAMIAKPDTITCVKMTVQLVGSGMGQSQILAGWTTTNGQILGQANALVATAGKNGTYIFTTTDTQNGCSAKDTTTVEIDTLKPFIKVAQPGILTCKDSTVTVSGVGSQVGAGFSFGWTTVVGHFVAGQNELTATVDKKGTYLLKIKDLSNGCEAAKQVLVIENRVAPPAEAGPSKTLTCSDSIVSLGKKDSLGLVYFWKTTDGRFVGNSSVAEPKVDAVGTYFLTTTDPVNGCKASDFVEIFENRLSGGAVVVESPACIGDVGRLEIVDFHDGIEPISFSIDDGKTWQTDSIFPELSPAIYTAMVRDAGGCVLKMKAEVMQGVDIQLFVDETATISLGDVYKLYAYTNVVESLLDSISWSPSATLSCADCLETRASPLETTLYRLFVADANGCSDEAFVNVKVTIPPIYAPNAISSATQNADNQYFTLFADPRAVLKIKKLQIFDRWGELVFSKENFPISQPLEGWGGGLRSGQMQPGVFVWWAEVEWINGRTTLLKGDVTVAE